jgi:hypothetical protein
VTHLQKSSLKKLKILKIIEGPFAGYSQFFYFKTEGSLTAGGGGIEGFKTFKISAPTITYLKYATFADIVLRHIIF